MVLLNAQKNINKMVLESHASLDCFSFARSWNLLYQVARTLPLASTHGGVSGSLGIEGLEIDAYFTVSSLHRIKELKGIKSFSLSQDARLLFPQDGAPSTSRRQPKFVFKRQFDVTCRMAIKALIHHQPSLSEDAPYFSLLGWVPGSSEGQLVFADVSHLASSHDEPICTGRRTPESLNLHVTLLSISSCRAVLPEAKEDNDEFVFERYPDVDSSDDEINDAFRDDTGITRDENGKPNEEWYDEDWAGPLTVAELEHTRFMMPSAWEGKLDDGREIYIKHRWGGDLLLFVGCWQELKDDWSREDRSLLTDCRRVHVWKWKTRGECFLDGVWNGLLEKCRGEFLT